MGIHRIDTAAAPEPGTPAPERILSGSPRFRTWNAYEDATGVFFAGIWEGDPGSWHVAYTEDEFCHLLEGEVVITDADGRAESFRAGDSFVVPAGFTGTWDVRRRARKLYAVHQPKA